jgi:hypothetical protein
MIGPTQTRSTWRPPPKNVELMPQHQDLGFQLLSRPEAVAQHATPILREKSPRAPRPPKVALARRP